MGAKQSEITFFTVPDTGIGLKVRKVSYPLVQEIQKKVLAEFPKPEPPTQTVDYGSGPEVEKNLAHPDYLAAVKEWESKTNEEMEERTRRLLIKVGVEPYLDWNDEKKAEVEALRQVMQEEFGVELERDDKYVWIVNCAMGTIEDWSDFTTYLMRRNKPTELGVQEAQQKF